MTEPNFWQTWWFYVVLAIVVIGLILLLVFRDRLYSYNLRVVYLPRTYASNHPVTLYPPTAPGAYVPGVPTQYVGAPVTQYVTSPPVTQYVAAPTTQYVTASGMPVTVQTY